MNKLKQARTKFEKGDSLSDNELNLLISCYKDLSEKIDVLNDPAYSLVQRDLWNKLHTLQGYRKSRDEIAKKI